MKKSVCTYKVSGTGFTIDLEILCDINRELTDTDHKNLRNHIESIMESLHEETIRLNPKSKEESEAERSGILGIFNGRQVFVEEIPNGYCSNYCCKHLPWFIVTTNKGKIKIGWRKRVINIDWSESTIAEYAKALFPNEDVTKFDKTIHAWGYDKAKEYIDLLLE